MGFWGVEVKPGKPYTFSPEEAGGRLNLTQATLGLGNSAKKSVLQCNVGDKIPVFLCSLLPEKYECCPLNLGFDEDVDFSVIGPTSIHITGVLEEFGDCCDKDYDDSDSFGEDIADTQTEDSSDFSSEGSDFDFIDDDDMEMYDNQTARKSGVVIEEIEEDEIPATEKSAPESKKKKKQSDDSGDAKNSHLRIVPKGKTDVLLESEDEDGFPVSAKGERRKNKDHNNQVNNLKRKVDLVEGDQKQQRGNPTGDASGENMKQQKKKKHGAVINEDKEESKDKGSSAADKSENDKTPNNENEQGVGGDTTRKKKRKNKKKKAQDGVSSGEGSISASAEKNAPTSEDRSKTSKPKQSHVRTFSNGLVIEELEMGKPDGRRASAGNKVGVHYIGKLKNGKIFDSNVGKAPFKFRLGIGQVIKGWDVGVEGMRVGDKRRLTIPPSMGYGARGAPPQIPPNAWLVFDVGLVNVS